MFGHRSRPIFVLLLTQWFKSGDFVFMQDSAPCSAHRAKATQDDARNVVPDFTVQKTSSSSAAVTKQHGDQFSTFSVECLLRLPDSTLLSISVKVSNINMNFCVHINVCLLFAY